MVGFSAASLGCIAPAKARDAEAFWHEGREHSALRDANFDPRRSLAPLLKAVQPAVVVVRIHGRKSADLRQGFPWPPGMDGMDGSPAPQGMGSGFIISDDGYIVTNHHVVEHGEQVQVQLDDRRVFDAKVVGSDPETDLALLKIKPDGKLPTVVLGSSDKLEVGDWVVAIGSPMGLEYTATTGIVSAKDRGSLGLYEDSFVDFLQLDAALAPGNSGGPLFNLDGEVVGVNTAVGRFAAGSGAGFAIPIDQAKQVMPQLRQHGHVTRGWLGIAGRSVIPATAAPSTGAEIGVVYSGTPAQAAGLRQGDRIVAVGSQAVADFSDLRSEIANLPPKSKLDLTIVRDGKTRKLVVILEARPGHQGLAQLRRQGGPASERKSLYSNGRPRLGIRVEPGDRGLSIRDVDPDGIGHELGLRVGDTLVAVNGQAVASPEDVHRALSKNRKRVEIKARRGQGTHSAVIER